MTTSNKSHNLFESEICPRCGGSGQYSFNLLDGSRCYGCSGSGWKLTKRGQAANDFYRSMLTVKADQLIIGDVIQVNDFSMGKRWAKVETIDLDNKSISTNVVVIHWGGSYVEAGVRKENQMMSFRRKPRTDEEAREILAKAMEFQASLNKIGNPSKVRNAKIIT